MNVPYQLGDPLPDTIWQTVKFRTVFECSKWDVQSEDHCVLAEFPLLIAQSAWQELAAITETLSHELVAAERELLGRRDLQAKLGLPRALQKEFGRLAEPTPGVARVMRFDFHFTDEGWRISEVNADVPGGFIEASGFTQLMAAYYPGTITPPDPASTYACTLSRELGPDALVGLVHATGYSDDHQVMQFLGKRMNKYGLRTVLASPVHILWDQTGANISSTFANGRLDAMVRFFPAEWLPTLPRSQWTPFFTQGRTRLSNPASAILVQSKRFPLVWDSLSTDLRTWRAILPETVCPSAVANNLTKWVVKPALGRVGEDIAIASVTAEHDLQLIHQAARRCPFQWVAQRRFHVIPVSNGSVRYFPSIGIFVIGGVVAGAYARVGRKPLIDGDAQDISVLITGSGENT